jgi:ATP-dependent Clp protease ATP-binding subunit ClpX
MPKSRYCSFCGKAEHEIFYLVEGPAVFICDECVVLAADVVQNQRARAARGETIQRGPRTWAEFMSERPR